MKNGAGIAAGIDHQNYRITLDQIPASIRDALAADLDPL